MIVVTKALARIASASRFQHSDVICCMRVFRLIEKQAQHELDRLEKPTPKSAKEDRLKKPTTRSVESRWATTAYILIQSNRNILGADALM